MNGSDVFRAVAHPVRREILAMLRKRPHTAGEIAEAFRIGRTSLSAHLRVLLAARLVSQRRVGRHRRYELRRRSLGTFERWVKEVTRASS